MRNFLLTIECDGSSFFGLQVQSGMRTVESVFRLALSKILKCDWRLIFSSRTDSGVHSLGQTALLRIDGYFRSGEILFRAINSLLPHDVRLTRVVSVDSDFHPRGAARFREYNYLFFNGAVPLFFSSYVASVSYDPSFSFDAISSLFLGEHDFSAFKATGGSHRSTSKMVLVSKVCDVEINIGISGARFIAKKYVIVADSFLYRMVRNIVGVMFDCARCRISPAEVNKMLTTGVKSFPFRTAPAKGLFLKKVYY